MTSDTQKAREWISKLLSSSKNDGEIDGEIFSIYNSIDAVYRHSHGTNIEAISSAYAAHVSAEKDRKIERLKTEYDTEFEVAEQLCRDAVQFKAERDTAGQRIAKLEEALRKAAPFAYRLLWLAFVWNDHNFEPAHTAARLTCEKHGIKSFDEGNAYLESVEAALTPSTERGEKE